MSIRIPHGESPVEVREFCQQIAWKTEAIHSGGAVGSLLISAGRNTVRPIWQTVAEAIDHGELSGLGDDDHAQYHTDARGDARYFRENEHLAVSAGAVDAGKPIVLDAAGHVDATMINDGDIDHGSVGGLGDDDHAIYSLVDCARPFTGVIGGVGFARTGWPLVPGVTLSFDDGTLTFTVTDGGSAYYYIDGVKYILGGNKTVTITDTEGLWYIYFDGATLTASQATWVIAASNKALVSYLYWDATNNESFGVGNELHGYVISAATHSMLHYTVGARWQGGLLVSDAGAERVNVSAGVFYDEDLIFTITDGAGGAAFEQVLSPAEIPILYQSGATDWRFYDTADKANAVDVGYVDGSNDLHYNKLTGTWASTAAGVGKYVAYWIIATNNQDYPIIAIMGQRIDTTLNNAKDNNVYSGLSVTGLYFQEISVLARVIVKATAGGVFYTIEDVQDLRASASFGNVTSPLITDHGGLAGLGDDDHPIYLLADGTRALTGNMAVDVNITIDGRDISVDGAALDTTVAIEGMVGVDVGATPDYLGVAAGDGVLRTNAAITWADGGNFVTLSCNPGLVDRGDPAAFDFEGIVGVDPPGSDDFTCDSTKRELDLSGIVPAGAYAVSIMFQCSDTAANAAVFFYGNAQSNAINVIQVFTQVANVTTFSQGWVLLDANRKIAYWANVDTTLKFVVRGWYI